MNQLLNIEEPRGAQQALAPDWRATMELGFRPLYLAGTSWALLSIGLWIFAPQWIGGTLSGIAWHAHEALWGFVATIAVGFLLTAGATWTGINPLSGRPLAGLCLLWIVARIGYLVPHPAALWVAAASESLFFLIAAMALLRAVHKSRNRRNYGVPWLVLALGAANVLYLAAARGGDFSLLMQRFDIGLLCMALTALLVARRVIPFFAMRAMPGLQIPMCTRSGQLQLSAGVAAIAFILARVPYGAGAALALAGLCTCIQVLAWKPLAVRRRPLLWVLYAGYGALGAGLIASAAHAVGWIANPALHVHLIAVGGFGLLIIGMVTRTALGHLGRPLALDASIRASYWCMVAAALLRLTAVWASPASTLLLQLAAIAWMAAFALYLWRFAPMLVRPRNTPSASPMAGKSPIRMARGTAPPG